MVKVGIAAAAAVAAGGAIFASQAGAATPKYVMLKMPTGTKCARVNGHLLSWARPGWQGTGLSLAPGNLVTATFIDAPCNSIHISPEKWRYFDEVGSGRFLVVDDNNKNAWIYASTSRVFHFDGKEIVLPGF
jgi:hypothetical protein